MGDEMLTKCANPSCTREFRYFSSGKLFLVEADSRVMTADLDLQEHGRDIKFYWLCEECVSMMTTVPDKLPETGEQD